MNEPDASKITLRRLVEGNEARLVAASPLFDLSVTAAGARRFLGRPGRHLLPAERGTPKGRVE